MNTAVYAEKTAKATDSMIEACQRLAAVEGFEDVGDLVASATHKDPDAKVLLQRETFAQVMQRVADKLAPKPAEKVVVADDAVKGKAVEADDEADDVDTETDDDDETEAAPKTRKPQTRTGSPKTRK